MTNLTMKPSKFGSGSSGKPAIEWWRHGVASAGEPSVVTEVREYPSEAARQAALFAPEPAEHTPVLPPVPFTQQSVI